MSNKSLKSRINKFIFEDGKVFLRLKTNAKDLKVQRSSNNYEMVIPTHSKENNFTAIPVVWINDFTKESVVENDAKDIGFAEESLERAVTKTKEKWGTLTLLKDSQAGLNYYYISPNNKDYAVKIGPIHKGVDGTKLEIDWANLQLGGEGA